MILLRFGSASILYFGDCPEGASAALLHCLALTSGDRGIVTTLKVSQTCEHAVSFVAL